MKKVALVGVGFSGFRSTSQDLSYREMIHEAAVKCYEDAGGVHPKDIDSFVQSSEDFMEGVSIADEYVPDQLGAVLKPVQSICGDGIQGLATAAMQIQTGEVDLVSASSFSKVSNVLNYNNVVSYAADPIYIRPLGENPYFIAGMEMNRYLYETGVSREQCARVVSKNKANALFNETAAYGAKVTIEDVLESEELFSPMTFLDTSQHADGAVVFLLASEEKAKELFTNPVWIKGIGWGTDSPNLDTRFEWSKAKYAEIAADKAYQMAGITSPREQLSFAEIDDTFSYKELQHLEALKICAPGEAGDLLDRGIFYKDGSFPVNVSGGNLGVGNLHDANGLQKMLEVVLQLRGAAGRRQLPDVHTGLAFAWRGLPTATGAAVVLSREEN